MPPITIHYTRLPDHVSVFRQRLVHRTPDCAVTLLDSTPLARPVRVGTRVVLEDGAPVVWFTFAGAWHDIGRFHTADGTFTGCYANVLTPVVFRTPTEWETTDLFLDVWHGADGTVALLDEDQLAAATGAGTITPRLAATARAEADRLLELARAGAWPPRIVLEWTLQRARAAAGTLDNGTG